MTYADPIAAIVERLSPRMPGVTVAVRLYPGQRPAVVPEDTRAGGRPILEGAVWQARVDLNGYPGEDVDPDDALALVSDARDRLVILGWTGESWSAAGLIVTQCRTEVSPYLVPDLDPREPRAICTVSMVYRRPQQ